MVKQPAHLVLLGDSIFDNWPYVAPSQAVIDHFSDMRDGRVVVTMLARDGDVTADARKQVRRIPNTATHIALSIGGNDALEASTLVYAPTDSVSSALNILEEPQSDFHKQYKALMAELAQLKKPILVCTIYDNIPGLTSEFKVALSLYNDVITRCVLRREFDILDLRFLLDKLSDYSSKSPIEPSELGGLKIVEAIFSWCVNKSSGGNVA